MKIHADKERKGKGQSTSNEFSPNQSAGKPAFQFTDNRPGAHANRKLQEMANLSAQAKQATQFQSMAANQSLQLRSLERASVSPSFGQGVIQNAVNVQVEGEDTPNMSIKATGDVEDFKGGDSAGNRGWNNVTSYAGRVYIDRSYFKRTRKGDKKWYTKRETVRAGPYNNNYLVAEAGHVLARQNGGRGSDPANVFAQDGGVNNGPWKANFENPMRRILNQCYDDDQVDFRVGLHGDDDISEGNLDKISDGLDADHESVFDTTDESDSGSD
jgi:hypothetical protein